jgi:hypothetical protein
MEYIFCGKKMKIAVFIDTKLDSGGSFQCSTSNIKNLSQSTHKDFNFIFLQQKRRTYLFLKKLNVKSSLSSIIFLISYSHT